MKITVEIEYESEELRSRIIGILIDEDVRFLEGSKPRHKGFIGSNGETHVTCEFDHAYDAVKVLDKVEEADQAVRRKRVC